MIETSSYASWFREPGEVEARCREHGEWTQECSLKITVGFDGCPTLRDRVGLRANLSGTAEIAFRLFFEMKGFYFCNNF